MATRTREQIMGRGYMDAYEEEQKRKAEEGLTQDEEQSVNHVMQGLPVNEETKQQAQNAMKRVVANAGAAQVDSAANEPVTNIVPPKPVETPKEEKKVSNYDDMMGLLYPPETAVERAQREKRQARESMFAGIGDAISAISNMYAATQGVPSTYNPQTTMSASMQRRHDRINAEREKDRQAYLSNYARVQQMKNADEMRKQQAELRKLQLEQNAEYRKGQLEIKRQEEERKKEELALKREVEDARKRQFESAADKNYAQAEYWRAYADLRQAGYGQQAAMAGAKLAETQARTEYVREKTSQLKQKGGKDNNNNDNSKPAPAQPVKQTNVSWKKRG